MLPVVVKVIIEGDELTIDLTGSSEQVATASTRPSRARRSRRSTFIARMIFLDEVDLPVFVPQNEGMLKPVKVIAPEGTIFNPSYPRATNFSLLPGAAAADLALQALAPVIPERSPPATPPRSTSSPTPAGTRKQSEYWVYLEVNEGSLRRPLDQATAGLRRLASSPTRATTRSRSSSGGSRCGPTATNCATRAAAPASSAAASGLSGRTASWPTRRRLRG